MTLLPISCDSRDFQIREEQQPKTGFLKNGQLIQVLKLEKCAKESPTFIADVPRGILSGLIMPVVLMLAAKVAAVFDPFEFVENYFLTAPNCRSECDQNGECGKFFDFGSCNRCIEKCDDSFHQKSAEIVMLAWYAAGIMGGALEYSFEKLSGLANRWKNKDAIQNINSSINKLMLSEQYPFRVTDSDITKLNLSKEARQNMISSMNIAQLVELRKQLGEDLFNIFSDQMLDENSKNITDLLSNGKTITLTTVIQIIPLMINDISIWMEIVKRVSPENFILIEDALREIGKNDLKIGHIDEVIEDLRSDYSGEIFLKVSNRGQTKKIPVNTGILLKYEFFKTQLNGPFSESHQKIINLELSDIEYYGFQDLINFIKSRNEDIVEYFENDLDLALSILAISSKYGLTNYLIISYEYLIKIQDKLNIKDLTNYLLNFANIDLLYKNNEAFIQELFTKACNKKDYVLIDFLLSTISKNNSENLLIYCLESEDEGLTASRKIQNLILEDPNISRMVFQYELPQTQELITDYLLKEIIPGIQTTNILDIYSDINPLTTHLENKFFGLIHIGIFKNLWDYSERAGKNHLKKGCLDFLKTLNPLEIRDVIRQWPVGKTPDEISALVVQ